MYKLLEGYWIIEICANLWCIFDAPIIILCSFKILENGKWYNNASGLFTFEWIIKIKAKVEIINDFFKNFFNDCEKYFFCKIMDESKMKIAVFIYRLNGKKN